MFFCCCLFCIEADFPLSISGFAFISISFLAHNIQKAVTIQTGQMLMRIVCIFNSFCSVKISMFVWNFYERIAWLHGTISHIAYMEPYSNNTVTYAKWLFNGPPLIYSDWECQCNAFMNTNTNISIGRSSINLDFIWSCI